MAKAGSGYMSRFLRVSNTDAGSNRTKAVLAKQGHVDMRQKPVQTSMITRIKLTTAHR
jgi:hypothetical protein